MGAFKNFLRRVLGTKTKQRSYAAAKSGALSFTASSSSADTELYLDLRPLRDKSRALVRDNVYAKRAKTIVVNNVIGQGVGMQARVQNDRRQLSTRLNDAIEAAWKEWAMPATCHTGGELSFSDLERLCMMEVFEAGEVLIRVYPRAFGGGEIPLALEVIEAERIADDHEIPVPAGANVYQGFELDEFNRPLAVWVHQSHPHIFRTRPAPGGEGLVRIPADQFFHIRIIERWPQTRGVPWMHSAINRLNQQGEFEEAAVIAARIGASKVGFFENPEYPGPPPADEEAEDGQQYINVKAGDFTQLPPGYKLSSWDPNYPDAVVEQFIRAMLRGTAAGIGVSYEALSRDYSQSNYSSSRLGLLDDRDLWRVIQSWWIETFRTPLHRLFVQQSALSAVVPGLSTAAYLNTPRRFDKVKFKPRGWSWVDPPKEVSAYKEAERAGYITKADVIAATGGGKDLEDYISERAEELEQLDDAGISTDTTAEAEEPAPTEPPPRPDNDDDEEETEEAGTDGRLIYFDAKELTSKQSGAADG